MVKASFSKALKMKLVFVFASSVVWAVISVATLVFKVEQHVLGDQLLVDEGDMALFFHEESLGVQNKDIKSDWDQHAAPSRCSSLPKHAIIIPYRDRLEHMDEFLGHMGPYLARNFPDDDFTVYFIEQGDSRLFSRGFLINVGITEASRRLGAGLRCVLTHDVDLIPKSDQVPYNWCDHPIRLGSELQHYNWDIPYPSYCGGVVSMNIHDWKTINGMSNDYEGWGGEDDDIYIRLKQSNLLFGNYSYKTKDNLSEWRPQLIRPPKGRGVFVNIEGGANQRHKENLKNKNTHKQYKYNIEIFHDMRNGSTRWKEDGLNDLLYSIQGDYNFQMNYTTRPPPECFHVQFITALSEADSSYPHGKERPSKEPPTRPSNEGSRDAKFYHTSKVSSDTTKKVYSVVAILSTLKNETTVSHKKLTSADELDLVLNSKREARAEDLFLQR